MLATNGYLSQFLNFKTYSHDNPRDVKRSNIILQGVARQIIQKTGTRLWWVNIPSSLPTPCVFVGVDVFHAPRVYDPKQNKKVAKGSCAAIIVQINRGGDQQQSQVEMFSQTFARKPGKEYDLGEALKETVSAALRELNVAPQSCIVWRDGIGESSLYTDAQEEINGVRAGLKGGIIGTSSVEDDIPLSYVVCQKRIDTKILAKGVAGEPDGKYGAPSGTLVEGIQGLHHTTFYINGNAPPYSTAKPVRFIVVHKDEKMEKVPLPELTWELCHDYPNWVSSLLLPNRSPPAPSKSDMFLAAFLIPYYRLGRSRYQALYSWLISSRNWAAALLIAERVSTVRNSKILSTSCRVGDRCLSLDYVILVGNLKRSSSASV
jgi:hypothetical protein